ncbi:Putative metabolite transport protein NicT [Massilia sp. Bi118]|uniref:MFS transporter n=1 Tax=Massilia sp. Bi118 TaxID=2822346 RepID=UPI001D4C5041|nr:MFS transporter [Massilia sp. Bi118]CAH0307145.1 Putative metabolite transport protein NicT [Massilia sp. Bi118]
MLSSTKVAVGASTIDEASKAYSKVAWRLLPFLFLCYVFAYLDRVNVGFAKLQMMSDLGLSEAVYGMGAGVFFAGYLMFEVPSNIVMLKVGARKWITRIMVTWGVISAAMMYVSTPASFYALRFLLGVAEAGFFPAILLYLTYWFPAGRRGKVTALFMTGIPMSGVIGGPLSGLIMGTMDNVGGYHAWQWVFVLEAIPTIILGCMAWFYLDDKVADAKWLDDSEKSLIEHELNQDKQGGHLHNLRDGLVNPRVWLLSAIYLFYTMGLYGISFWLPTIIKASGVSSTFDIGMLTSIPYAAATVTMILVGRSSDIRRERRWHLALAGVAGAVGLTWSAAYGDNTPIAMLALTLATMGIITTISQFWLLPPAVLTGAAAAAGIALANSVGSVSGMIAPYMLGVVKTMTNSTNAGVIAIAVCLLVGCALTFALPAKAVNPK